MVKRVLVGLDFSPSSRVALGQGAAWAKRLEVPLVALHVIEHPERPLFELYAPLGDPHWFKTAEPMAKGWMEEWLAPYPGSEQVIRTGSPSKILAEEADAGTLLVVGNVGHNPLGAALFGTTAERVVRHAKGNVLVVRTDDQ